MKCKICGKEVFKAYIDGVYTLCHFLYAEEYSAQWLKKHTCIFPGEILLKGGVKNGNRR